MYLMIILNLNRRSIVNYEFPMERLSNHDFLKVRASLLVNINWTALIEIQQVYNNRFTCSSELLLTSIGT